MSLNLIKFFTKSFSSLDLNSKPLKLSFIISFGPSGQSLEKTGDSASCSFDQNKTWVFPQ